MWNEDLERAAANGQPLPEGLDAPARSLYISLRGLYQQYKEGVLDKDQAKQEKSLLIKDYELAVLDEKCRQKSRELWKRIPSDIMKCQCDECRNVAKIILALK